MSRIVTERGCLDRREFLKLAGLAAVSAGLVRLARAGAGQGGEAKPRLNLLLITVDDLNCDSVNVFGGAVSQATPNIDRLASQSMRFAHAHVTVGVCQPSRSALLTGRYPHRSGGEGFHRITHLDTVTLWEQLALAGYRTGLMAKVPHCLPKATDKPDMVIDAADLGIGRNPELYYKYARQFMLDASKAGRPFFLMANSQDPHRPYSGGDQEPQAWAKIVPPPSRTYRPEEVVVPGFLPDLPDVRREIAEYFSSVRRCDDTVGAILKALAESGQQDNTLVMFLSDNGIAVPFAKTNCYLHSTHTPWLVCWPGKVRAGAVDEVNFISGIDYMPTVLDAAGLPAPDGMDGRSFLPLLRGQKQDARTMVFTQFHETSARTRFPMRCVQDKRFGYIFNPWSDGRRVFRNESQSGRTWPAMVRAAADKSDIAARVKLFQYRLQEELYDFQADPDALHNLASDSRYRAELDAMRGELRQWMVRTRDPALEAFDNRQNPEAIAKFMAAQDAAAARNVGAKSNAGKAKASKKAAAQEDGRQ